ncbi:MAG: TonB-dependent receptor plug domain-containing protein, partial [Planctomycetia bacterium]|nr:TonB-dependent receptor plug domain-containing protein [Planctomycetia bacterium]
MNIKTILIFLFSISISLSQNIIEGYVYNADNNEPITNANIILLGTADGSATNDQGFFQILTDQDFPITLLVNHIGYLPQQFTLSTPAALKITLNPAVLPSDEVSVIGIRSRADQDVSADVDFLSSEKMEQAGANDLADALRTLSSIQIVQTEGGNQTISIRGSNPNEVAVYLDGIRLNDANTGVANLAAIDQNDLSSIELIKGGNTSLYGTGAFGGVVNMNTRIPTNNSFELARGSGLLDDENQDLSVNASGRLGIFTLGGRYSGKARRYHGRSVYTTIFKNLTTLINPSFGEIQLKGFELQNYLKFPTQDIIQNAKTQMGMIRYFGSIFGSNNWELFLGTRNWKWNDKFFSNVDRDLTDINTTGRISHNILSKYFNSTAQLEYENQMFTGNNLYKSDLSSVRAFGEIERQLYGLSTSTQWLSNIEDGALENIRWEFGFRADFIKTNQFQKSDNQDTQNYQLPANVDTSFNDIIRSFKIGINAQGKKGDLGYNIYINQGRSKRLPTPNDIFLYHNANFASFKSAPLTESLESTEIGFEVNQEIFPTISYLSNITISGNIFINNYSDKIAYQYSTDTPPIPYNIDQSRISGFELGLNSSFWQNRINMQVGYQNIDLDNPLIYPN